jgi:hypothetical protein
MWSNTAVAHGPSESEIRAAFDAYFACLQDHADAETMMAAILTDDFETGFTDGFRWAAGIGGLREFLAAREGFFDERHQVDELLEVRPLTDVETEVKTSLHFFLRRWEPPAARSEEFTGTAFHTWRVRRSDGTPPWRIAAQLVDGFANLNENAARLFSTPDAGLNR